VALKNDLIALLSQQAVLMLRTHTDALSRIEARLAKSREFYAAVSDESEDSATAFVSSHGGVEVVRMVSVGFGLCRSPFSLLLDLE
jgi:hypothetical protein